MIFFRSNLCPVQTRVRTTPPPATLSSPAPTLNHPHPSYRKQKASGDLREMVETPATATATAKATAKASSFSILPSPRRYYLERKMNLSKLNCFPFIQHRSIRCTSLGVRKASSFRLYFSTGKIAFNARCTSRDGVSFLYDAVDSERSEKLLRNSNPASDFEEQLDELFAEVMKLIRIGDRDSVLDLLQANYEATKEQISAGNRTIELAATLDVVALGYIAIGYVKPVESLLEMMTDIVDGLNDDNQPLDSVLIHMGNMYTALGKFDEAMMVYRRGLAIVENLFGKQSPFLIMGLLGHAKALKLTGRNIKAIEIYRHTVRILEKSRGSNSEELVIPLSALGNLLISEGQAEDAESCFKRIITIYSKSYGEKDGRVGMAFCSLAHAICAKGDIEEAINLYRRSLDVLEDSKYMALDDDVLVKMRVDLAELLHVAGREQEGREILEECLLIAEKCKGSKHPSLVSHIINLATSYSRSKDFAEAERLLKVGIHLISEILGTKHQSVTVPMLHLAIVLYSLNRNGEAERYALEVLQIREVTFGRFSLPVAEALDCLISIQIRLGKEDDEVLEQLERLLSIQERELDYEHEDVILTLKKIVFYMDKMGKRNETLHIKRRLSEFQKKYRQKISV